MSAAKKRQYRDPSLEELLRDMPDDSCAVRDYGAMANELARLEDRVRELEGQLDALQTFVIDAGETHDVR